MKGKWVVLALDRHSKQAKDQSLYLPSEPAG